MATTFDYYVRNYRRSDGTRAVYIRMTHNRKSTFFPTSIYVTDRQVSKNMEIRDSRILDAIDSRLRSFRSVFYKVDHPEYRTLDELEAFIKKDLEGPQKFTLDIFDYAGKLMASMKPKTAEGYKTSLNAIKRFIGGEHLDINEITTQWLLRFRDFLETEPAITNTGGHAKSKKSGTYQRKSRGSRGVSYYMGCLRKIHNAARLEFNDYDTGNINIPRQPFAKGIIPSMPVTKPRAISAADIHKLYICEPKKSREALAKDVFFLSFALCGTNTIDLYNLQKTDLNGSLVTYRRSKTKDRRKKDHAEITLRVIGMAAVIIERYRSEFGSCLLDFSNRYSNSKGFNKAVNLGLKDLAEHAGINVNLDTYTARHSWATIARNILKADFGLVQSSLNQAPTGNDRITDIYIARDYSSIWAAQEKVAKIILEAENGIVEMKRDAV